MSGLLELAGAWLARAHAVYGFLVLLLPTYLFAHLVLLGAVVRAVAQHARGRQPWPGVPSRMRGAARLAVEVAFGLVNPVLYLAVLIPSWPALRSGAGEWLGPLITGAWILLAAFWSLRLAGSALDPRSRAVRAGIRTILVAALGCVLLYAVKDARAGAAAAPARASWPSLALLVLRVSPLYLVPAVLLWDYIRATSAPEGLGKGGHGLFLLPGRAARIAVGTALVVALLTTLAAAHRRSEANVRQLVADHRQSIRAASSRYGVDPRLVGAIVHVTHRDQLSPFRDALERVVLSAWALNLRGELGLRPPDHVERIGWDENPVLNRALDVSVGLAQVKPRTAQTASVLATGVRPDDLPPPVSYAYRDVEATGEAWSNPGVTGAPVASPLPVPAERAAVARTLLDAGSNLAMCALILSLYERQWEAANPAWSLRGRPDILATLYQLGFARSRPHGAPRTNAFGRRVGEVMQEPWLAELMAGAPPPG